jgi:hypothetical protein
VNDEARTYEHQQAGNGSEEIPHGNGAMVKEPRMAVCSHGTMVPR